MRAVKRKKSSENFFKKVLKKSLTNQNRCDIINKLSRKRAARECRKAVKYDCTLKNKQCRVLVSEREVHKNYEFFMTEIRNNNYEKKVSGTLKVRKLELTSSDKEYVTAKADI